EPKLAVLLLDPPPASQALAKLTQLSRQSDLPEVRYHLALAMAARGNHGGAAELLESVAWTDATVTDPIDLVLTWTKELAEAGKVGTAYEMAEVVQKNLPSDPRPLQHLIRLSAILGDADKE